MYDLPVWFLILSLFLPRVSLFVEWLHDLPFPFIQSWTGLSWIFIPRVLILIMIYSNQGFCAWFWIHLVVALLVLLGGGSAAASNN